MTLPWPLRLWLRLCSLVRELTSEETARRILWYDRTGVDLVTPTVLEDAEDEEIGRCGDCGANLDNEEHEAWCEERDLFRLAGVKWVEPEERSL